MHAVIVSGGKQYRVKEGDVLKVAKLEIEEGQDVVFDQVLMLSDGQHIEIGSPYLAGRTVQASVLSHGKAKKIRIIKFKRRKHHMKRQGHRQHYTAVRILSIAV